MSIPYVALNLMLMPLNIANPLQLVLIYLSSTFRLMNTSSYFNSPLRNL